jgi:hypothetical protein
MISFKSNVSAIVTIYLVQLLTTQHAKVPNQGQALVGVRVLNPTAPTRRTALLAIPNSYCGRIYAHLLIQAILSWS